MNNKSFNLFILHSYCRPHPFQSTPLQYSLRKGQVSPGHQQKMAYQAAIRPRTFPFIQTEQENPAERGPPESAKAPGTGPALTVWSPTNRPSYIAIYASSPRAGSLLLVQILTKFPWARLAVSFGFPIISLTCPPPKLSSLSSAGLPEQVSLGLWIYLQHSLEEGSPLTAKVVTNLITGWPVQVRSLSTNNNFITKHFASFPRSLC